MSETIHSLIEQYGLIAVFIGCVAEGETAAILAGFFSHQHVFVTWQAFVAVFLGAFGGDATFFLCGRRFADTPFVRRMRAKPGFDRAFDLMHRHPALYVIGNRYVYGFRLVGGVAAGLSSIAAPKFIVLNAISAFIWTALFVGIGYVFGLGAEQVLGSALHRHQRLLIGLAIGVVVGLLGWYAAHRFSRKAARAEAGVRSPPLADG
jgi:membrane protein DedA with SNARE-associated domain